MEYREYRPGDEKELNDLYNEVFSRRRTIEQWKWEYIDTPEGPGKILLVEDEGRVIGHEAMVPMRFQVFGEEFLGGKIEDAYIDKKYRGQKLFGPLTEKCIEISEKAGYSLTFGLTARPVNYQLHVTRGYRHTCSLNAYFAPLKPAAAVSDIARLLHFSPPKKAALAAVMSVLAKRFEGRCRKLAREQDTYEIVRIERFDRGFDEMWQELTASRRIVSIRRSSAFLNWRYIEMPYRRYDVFAALSAGRKVAYLCAAVVTREDMDLRLKVGVVSDFLVLPGHEAALPSLVRRAAEAWRTGDADVAIAWVHRDGTFSGGLVAELKRWGLVSTRGRYDIPFLVRTLGGKIDEGTFYDVASWHVTQAFGGAWV
jgi:predicted N-acetyltransferase YhbS